MLTNKIHPKGHLGNLTILRIGFFYLLGATLCYLQFERSPRVAILLFTVYTLLATYQFRQWWKIRHHTWKLEVEVEIIKISENNKLLFSGTLSDLHVLDYDSNGYLLKIDSKRSFTLPSKECDPALSKFLDSGIDFREI